MSTNKTPNLNLHSWEGTDYVKREEFNENFNIIDQNLKDVKFANTETAILAQGENTLQSTETTPLNVVSMQGNTVVNLIPPFTSSAWVKHANATVSNDGKTLTLNATFAWQSSKVFIKSVENKSYTFKSKRTGAGFIYIDFQNSSGTQIEGNVITLSQDTDEITFITPLGTATIIFTIDNGNTSTGSYVFDEFSLVEGTTAKPYTNAFRGIVNPTIEVGNTRHTLETTLHGMNGVYDEIIRESGVVKKVERFKEMVLDGSLNWAYSNGYSGFKAVHLDGITDSKGTEQFLDGLVKVSKFDGSILLDDNTALAPNRAYIIKSSSRLVISIENTDSGWGQDYTPTTDEIKAYLLGWKMYVSGSGADSQYNGTGTKGWVYRRTDGSYSQGYSVLPTTKAPDYNSYRLLYQKAQPETITVSTQGTATLDVGENTVKVTQGVVVREKANPYTESAWTAYVVNSSSKPTSLLKHKTNRILSVFKNGDEIISYNTAIATDGLVEISIPKSSFDTTATYYVTYEILPELTAQTDNIEVEYSQNIKSIVDEHTEQLSVHEERLDNMPSFIANTSGIVESGRNQNGEYVRFADGTQICWVSVKEFNSTNDTLINGVTNTFNFPSSFVDNQVSWSITPASPSTGWQFVIENIVITATTTSSYSFRWKNATNSISQIYRFKMMAIGRWK